MSETNLQNLMADSDSDESDSGAAQAELKATQAQIETELKSAPVSATPIQRPVSLPASAPASAPASSPAPAPVHAPAPQSQSTDYIRQLFSLVRNQVTPEVYQKITEYVKRVKESSLPNTEKRKQIMDGLIK
jgi:cell division septation protein DedD